MTEPDLRSRLANAILDGAAEAIVACDRDGIIRLWNPGAVRIFGFREAEALGRSLDLIIPERLRARHWDGYQAMLRTGQSRYGVGHVLSVPSAHKDGTPLSIEFTIVALNGRDGATEALIATMRDATAHFNELKALRQQIRARAAG
jgi:PAS domain S-box-containing protein